MNIESLRVTIASLKCEQKTLTNQVRSRSEVVAHVEHCAAKWEREAQASVHRTLNVLAYGHSTALMRAEVIDGTTQAPSEAEIGPLLTGLLGAARVVEFLLAGIDTVPEGLDTSDRLARLSVVNAELDRIEVEEERLIEASEYTSTLVPRRPDARPEIVLALPAEAV
jgi:hypothetical protein